MRQKIFATIIIFFLLLANSISAQINTIVQLDKEVTQSNDAMKYEKSIKIIVKFIADNNRTNYEKYRAYLLKAYTYKRVFNYLETLQNLDLALSEGLKSDRIEEAKNTIKSQKAFVYFDILEYEKASKLMIELEQSNYEYLSPEDKSFLIMQEGYLLMLKKKYADAEKKLDTALLIAKENCPRNLPNIYGKKIELYNNMNLYDKRDEAFKEGLKIAKKYKIIKYKMYLYEIMRNQYQNNNDYKNAFETQLKVDSLTFIYNSSYNNGKIQILETKLQNQIRKLEKINERKTKYFLIGLISVMALLLIISIRLYSINKQKKKLIESEYFKIYKDIEKLTKELDEKGNNRIDLLNYSLTERQKEIIVLVQDGFCNKDIGSKLLISENTVKYHLKAIYGILDIENRIELNS